MSTDLTFISYSPKDANKALAVANRLKDSGVNIWIDSLNLLSMPPGEDPDDFTESAIKSSKLFLIITSNHALKDASLKQEKECARENGVERVLVKIEDCDTNKFRWKSLPTLELFRDEEEAYKTLLRKLNITSGARVETVMPVQNNPVEPVQTKPVQEEIVPEVPIQTKPIQEEIVSEVPIQAKPIRQAPVTPQVSVASHTDLLDELLDDFQIYKHNLKGQIQNGYFGFSSLIVVSIVLISGLYVFNGLGEILSYTEKNFKYLTTLGGFLPSTFSTFSYSKIKEKKKRLQGVDFFDKQVSRMQRGLIPSTKQHVLDLEDEFLKYINT